MRPTALTLARAAESHRCWLDDFLRTGSSRSGLQVLETHECRMGVFLASIDADIRVHPGYQATTELHRQFHYYCSVVATLRELGCPVDEALVARIHEVSAEMLEALRRWAR